MEVLVVFQRVERELAAIMAAELLIMTDRNLKVVMESAKRLARESGTGYIDLPHLALSLLQHLNDPLRQILETECALDLDPLIARLSAAMPRREEEGQDQRELPFSPELLEVLETTMELRRLRGADEIRSEHLLAAVLKSEHVAWRLFLEESGIDALLVADLVLERASPNIDLDIEQIDVFASATFRGNPAAVVTLESWLSDALMQAIAAENNQSETAFTVPGDGIVHIRWFSPEQEVNFCGHATIAAARVLLDREPKGPEQIRFHSSAGPLDVLRDGDRFSLIGPRLETKAVDNAAGRFAEALGSTVLESHEGGGDLLLVVGDEETVASLRPDLTKIGELPYRGVIVTAKAESCDFVSRFFAPCVGIEEDPATGSAHCVLAPFWAERLGKSELQARQLSSRGGVMDCRVDGDHVEVTAMTHRYLRGRIRVPRDI